MTRKLSAEEQMDVFKLWYEAYTNETRKRITLLLSRSKTPLSISELQRRLERDKYRVSYKNVRENVKWLEKKGLVELSKVRGTPGQEVNVKLTVLGQGLGISENILSLINMKEAQKMVKEMLKSSK